MVMRKSKSMLTRTSKSKPMRITKRSPQRASISAMSMSMTWSPRPWVISTSQERRRSPKDQVSTTDALLADVLGTQIDDGRKRPPEAEVIEEDPVVEAPSEEAPVEEFLVEDEPLVEDELIEEELVEISAGEDGPSFNELAQLDLFIDQELFEDAVVILERLEGEYPGDADLALRREKLDGIGAMDQPASATEDDRDTDVVELVEVADPHRPRRTR